MTAPLTITFTDLSHKELGYVTYDGMKLTASNGWASSFLKSAQKKGLDAEDFVIHYSKWSNGRVFSEADTEDEPELPPKQ